MTGIAASNISKLIRNTISKKVVITEGRNIGINPVVSEWSNESNPTNKIDNEKSQIRLEKESNPTRGESNSTRKLVKSDPHNRKITNTKDNKHKKGDSSSSKSSVDFSCFNGTDDQVNEIKRIRKANKGGVITQRVANTLAKEFELAKQHGFNLEDCLNEWESRGWKAFKAEWIKPKQQYGQSHQPLDMDDTSWGEDLDEVL